MASGGKRTPSNPAPVSGPGALSRRTDGGPGNAKQPIRVPTGGNYGDATQLQQDQQGAALGASPGGDVTPVGGSAGLLSSLQAPPGAGLDQGTQRPGEPVTAGAASGAGPGPEALGLPNQEADDVQQLAKYLPVFEYMANQPGSMAASRNLVRSIKGGM